MVGLFLVSAATSSLAQTTLLGPAKYGITEGVAFTIGNSGADSFLFNWTDSSPALAPLSFSNVPDFTFVLTIGQTYTFQRTSSAHPFAIMNNTASAFIDGVDGAYFRTTDNGSLITAATIFTANPVPNNNVVSWTPSVAGDFWYTCTVPSHPNMTGKISVVPEPSVIALVGVSFLILLGRRFLGQAKHS